MPIEEFILDNLAAKAIGRLSMVDTRNVAKSGDTLLKKVAHATVTGSYAVDNVAAWPEYEAALVKRLRQYVKSQKAPCGCGALR